MEIVRLDQSHVDDLIEFMSAVNANAEDSSNFHPHGLFESTAEMELKLRNVAVEASGADPYFLGYIGREPVAYGFLRGWSEGYPDAFLGIAVRRERQGQGLGREMTMHLIRTAAAAADKGASHQLKLSVYMTNTRAVNLYRSLGFRLTAHPRRGGEFLGVLDLTPWMSKSSRS